MLHVVLSRSLSQGDPAAFLPIVSFTVTSFSPPFAEQLMAAGLELTGKSDLRFTDTFYKASQGVLYLEDRRTNLPNCSGEHCCRYLSQALRDILHYKPVLSKQQFLQPGFSQRKISLVCDVITLVLQKHNQLHKVQSSLPPPSGISPFVSQPQCVCMTQHSGEL